ncbi:hypothetical protein CPB83DRAFT_862222 [Crepidotus variabilis]|uniref:Secreted protein n=1 Tax=Crepidotus variabilis TaxID=179855 RepID=A0A9P6JKD8_9AGAR|nr:hypothetical protein CPB83DRAFT_862222 [Crepidotus variabilis]
MFLSDKYLLLLTFAGFVSTKPTRTSAVQDGIECNKACYAQVVPCPTPYFIQLEESGTCWDCCKYVDPNAKSGRK